MSLLAGCPYWLGDLSGWVTSLAANRARWLPGQLLSWPQSSHRRLATADRTARSDLQGRGVTGQGWVSQCVCYRARGGSGSGRPLGRPHKPDPVIAGKLDLSQTARSGAQGLASTAGYGPPLQIDLAVNRVVLRAVRSLADRPSGLSWDRCIPRGVVPREVYPRVVVTRVVVPRVVVTRVVVPGLWYPEWFTREWFTRVVVPGVVYPDVCYPGCGTQMCYPDVCYPGCGTRMCVPAGATARLLRKRGPTRRTPLSRAAKLGAQAVSVTAARLVGGLCAAPSGSAEPPPPAISLDAGSCAADLAVGLGAGYPRSSTDR